MKIYNPIGGIFKEMDALFNFIGSIFGYVLDFFNNIFGNFGVSIIFFTLFTRLLMFPLTIKQQKSMAGMQRLQPKMKELQEKYGNDKARYNEEVSKLYQRGAESCRRMSSYVDSASDLLWSLSRHLYAFDMYASS